jgi:oligopeptide transport system substrate-binding protein
MWEQINIKSEFFNAETPVHYDALRAGDYDVGRAGWLLDYSDPSNILDLLRTGTMQDGKMNWGNNYSRFSSAEFDGLMDQAAKETDLAKRAQLLSQAEKIGMDGVAVIPLVYYLANNVVKPSVKGFEDNAKDVHRTRWLTKTE